MSRYILKRIGLMIFTLWLIVSITFLAMAFVPGRPYPNYDKMTEEQREQMDHTYGYDRPLIVQYADYMTGIIGLSGAIDLEGEEDEPLFGFDMGYSFLYQQDVNDVIAKRYPVSLFLGMSALIVGCVIGLMLGVIAAIRRNSKWDYLATGIAVFGVSFPSFVLASYLQLYLATYWGLFPTTFARGDISSIILPVMALSVYAIAQVARVTRTEMVEVLGANYINLAKAKGVKQKAIISKHALRNSLITILTILGPLTISLTTGSLVIESIFGIPGIGGALVDGVLAKDTFLVCGMVLLIAIQVLVVYLIVDILYAIIDPRIRIGGGENA